MNPSPGWFPDPTTPNQFRWWDGQSWTANTTPAPTPAGATHDAPHTDQSSATLPPPVPLGSTVPQPGHTQQIAPTPADKATNYLPNLIAALAASVGIVIGSIGPWMTFMALSKNGIDGDGGITLVLGIVSAIALFSILARGGKSRIGDRWIGVVVGIVCLVITIVSIMDVTSRTTELFNQTVGAQVGWGLWLTALSAAVLCLTGLTVAKQTRRT